MHRCCMIRHPSIHPSVHLSTSENSPHPKVRLPRARAPAVRHGITLRASITARRVNPAQSAHWGAWHLAPSPLSPLPHPPSSSSSSSLSSLHSRRLLGRGGGRGGWGQCKYMPWVGGGRGEGWLEKKFTAGNPTAVVS